MNRAAFVTFGLAGALALGTAPAFAQHHRDGGGGDRRENAAPRQEQPRQERQPEPQQAQPRQDRREAPPVQPQAQPGGNYERAIPRDEYYRRNPPRNDGPRNEGPRYAPRYEPRYAPRYNGGSRYYGGGYYSGRYYGPRYVGPRFSVAPRRFYRPYYVFRPRFSIGFGIWSGYPVTYYDPFYYPYDYYPYSTAPVYPVGPQGSVYVQPYSQSNMGGISFDITPESAEVWVDGNYMGEVGQFTASSQPLGLPAGRHRLELREPGFEVSTFDVDVIGGQVIPFQGQLQP